MKLHAALLSLAVLIHSSAFATDLPPNNLHLLDQVDKIKDIDEALFHQIIDRIAAVYAPFVQLHGANLIARRNWADPTVNAYASQIGNNWFIDFFGGYARREEMTPDAFSLVVCHEVGHHLGGHWFYSRDSVWASGEGQADYFSTQACARTIWKEDKAGNAKHRATVDRIARRACDSVWKAEDEQNLCYRIAKAAEDKTLFYANSQKLPPPKAGTPDPRQVEMSDAYHPAPQCRFDTYFQAALCLKPFDPRVIPGKNHPAGNNSVDAELVASNSSCMTAQGFALGARPRCWFKPQVSNFRMVTRSSRLMESSGNRNGIVEPGETARLSFRIENLSRRTLRATSMRVLSRTPGVHIIQGESQVAELAPGRATTNLRPVLVKIDPSVPCGTPIDLELRSRNESGTAEAKLTHSLGRTASAFMGAVRGLPPIDGRGPLSSVIEARNAGNVNLVSVKVNLTHARPGDLRLSLVLPNGQMKLLRDRQPTSGDQFNATFHVALPSMPAKGRWRLVVSDRSPAFRGRLEAWELTGTSAECWAAR